MIKFGNRKIKKVIYNGREIKTIQDANGVLYNKQAELNYTVNSISFTQEEFEQMRNSNSFALNVSASGPIDNEILNYITCYIDQKEVVFGKEISGFTFDNPIVNSLINKIVFSISTNIIDFKTFKVVFKDRNQELTDEIQIRYFYNYITNIVASTDRVYFYREFAGRNTYFSPTETVNIVAQYRSNTEPKHDSLQYTTLENTTINLNSDSLTISPNVGYDSYRDGAISIYSQTNPNLKQQIIVQKAVNNFTSCYISEDVALLTGKTTRVPIEVTWELGQSTGEENLSIYFDSIDMDNGVQITNVQPGLGYMEIYLPQTYFEAASPVLNYQPTPSTDIWGYKQIVFDIQNVSYMAVDLTNIIEQYYAYNKIGNIFLNSSSIKMFQKYQDNIYLIDYDLNGLAPSKKVELKTESGWGSQYQEHTYEAYRQQTELIGPGIYQYIYNLTSTTQREITMFPFIYNTTSDGQNYAITDVDTSKLLIEYITIPKTYLDKKITRIDSQAFQHQKEITAIDFGNIETIGYAACKGMTLSTIHFSSDLKVIDIDAFKDTTLNKIIYRGTEEDWSRVTIYLGNEAIKNAEIVFEP